MVITVTTGDSCIKLFSEFRRKNEMEKYYLGQLGGQTDLERRIKFVEVQYARRAPSLGLVHLSKAKAAGKSGHELHLASLEVGANNEAKFGVLARIKLSNLANVIDFDTLDWVEAEVDAGQLNCILLARDTSSGHISLYNVPLISSASEGNSIRKINLPSSLMLNSQRVTRCHIKETRSEEATQNRFVHLLSDRCYQSFQVVQGNNSLLASQIYAINSDSSNYVRFVDFSIMDTNQDLALLEVSDSSLRIVHKSQCLASFSLVYQLGLGQHQRHLLLTGDSKTETLLVSASQTHLVAHSIHINEGLSKRREDPDNLLPSEPSFELEQCWSLDLNDLDSIRSLDSSTKSHKQWACSLCTMRSADEQSSSSWPKFLIVAHQFHLLVYSFEQYNNIQSLPFSIVYDRSFLAQTQQTDADPTKKQSFVIDPQLRPKLVHNFKLIGPQPSDALFNTLFQAKNDRLSLQRHFNHLGILASLSESGHLFGFKFNSPKLVQQKDNLYQQLVCDSIRGSSRLLLDQVEAQQRSLMELKENLVDLETKSEVNIFKGQQQELDKLLQAQLYQRHDIGGLYSLHLSVSNLVQVAQILIVSTTSSYISKPLNLNHIHQIHIDNELNKSTRDKPILLTSSFESQDERRTLVEERPIEACAIIDLDYKFKSIELSLPIFIMDGRFKSQLKVFYILQDSNLKNVAQLQKLPALITSMLQQEEEIGSEDELEKSIATKTALKYYSMCLEIKPLISYQIPGHELRLLNQRDHQQLTCELRGAVNAKVLASWLQDCIASTTTTVNQSQNQELKSPFTHCSIGYNLRDGELSLSSDDMFALELIKGHILKEATNQGIKLEVKQTPESPTVEHLKHLIELQTINFGIANRLREQSESLRDKTKDDHKKRQTELLLESLMCEVSSNSLAFPAEFKTPPLEWVEESFRNDIEQLVQCHDLSNPEKSDSSKQEESAIFTDLVCGFIIDILVDFDRMFGSGANAQRSSADKMIMMRSKILKIIAQHDVAKGLKVVTTILADWNECRLKSDKSVN